MNNIQEQFKHAMGQYGLTPPDILEPGILYRFAGKGKKAANKSAYCKLFINGNGGFFGDYTRGIRETWFANKADYALVRKAQTKHHDDTNIKQKNAATKARQLWVRAKAANPHHAYLMKKQVLPYKLKQNGKDLIVPIYDQYDNMTTLQFIKSNGEKRFLSGGKKQGCCTFIGGKTEILYLCEGWATGATIHAATNCGVIVALDSNNLKNIAAWLTQKYPESYIFVCADNDITGVDDALKAAKSINQRTEPIIPQFPKNDIKATDFNDLMALAGINSVRKQIEEITQSQLEFLKT